jgi:flagellum-specific peptidoglycan hydrolase FlgJ
MHLSPVLHILRIFVIKFFEKAMRKRLWKWVGFGYLLFLLWYWFARPGVLIERPAHTETYVQAYGRLAVELGRQTGIPPAIILAVGGLESAWGASELARQGNNHFGIKIYDPHQDSYCLPTQEYEKKKAMTVHACFRAYPHARDSFRDFTQKLTANPRYAMLFGLPARDYESWAKGLQHCGYATDPRYARKLIKVVEAYHLDEVGK